MTWDVSSLFAIYLPINTETTHCYKDDDTERIQRAEVPVRDWL